MQIAITGSHGFIGQNLKVRLAESAGHDVVSIPHDADEDVLNALLSGTDCVFHLAGVNRPDDAREFEQGNHLFTERLCRVLSGLATPPKVVFASSIQAALDNPYGLSKRNAEAALIAYGESRGARVHLFRLANVFGKWSRPNYNSAVATFCHNIARDIPVTVHDPEAIIRLVHIDDVVGHFCMLLADGKTASGFCEAGPEYQLTVGELVQTLQRFRSGRKALLTERVGTGLVRRLYATYVSFLPVQEFHYDVPVHADPRGVFVEMLKTPDCGQFSYFTAHPGITRGEHYHHAKTEKFLVIKGRALFGFRHIVSGETHELIVQGGDGRIVETVPGWTHNITNVGEEEMIVMLWANEVFDPAQPDTIARRVAP
ncbi:MAG: NAD-dependent epimerase/dehydratase family protein [Ramlibacter sp.]|nr:NAD-dependent epimerase/dehydratase family protein [Ramlibacter sp.]